QEEPFPLPDVVLCPSAGDGCDADDGMDCLPMNWYISTVEVVIFQMIRVHHLEMTVLRQRLRRWWCRLSASKWRQGQTSCAREFPYRSAPLTTIVSRLGMCTHCMLPFM
ncbi:unnamed protein product, partial [Ectocarpus sp. 4 AP-2014]